jgi:hypothetical protein
MDFLFTPSIQLWGGRVLFIVNEVNLGPQLEKGISVLGVTSLQGFFTIPWSVVTFFIQGFFLPRKDYCN